MKKFFISVIAIAAIAACTKSEVQYETPGEIGFAPVKGNITKATGLDGVLADTQELGVWAFWDKDGSTENPTETTVDDVTTITPIDYTKYTDDYLVNALFANPGSGTNWGAPTGKSYPWPVNGALVFAGYTTPGDDVLANDSKVKYTLSSDEMIFTEYENTDEFDLCWFGRTASSYNNRVNGDAVEVDLSHALSWITIAVVGEGSPVGNWTITSMSLTNVIEKGTATCKGKTATWNAITTSSQKTIYEEAFEDGHTISDTATELTDNVLIPSTAVQLTIGYSFKVNDSYLEDSVTVTLLGTGDTWESGKHYTYTLNFKGNEILIAPEYEDWGTVNQSVTVE